MTNDVLHPTGFYLANAHHMARLAKLAYVREFQGGDEDLLTMYPRRVAFEQKNIEGFVAANDQHVVVSLRGTDEPADWLNNLYFTQVDGYGGKVHHGFAEGLDLVWKNITKAVTSLRTGAQTLWVTGHSLGGALATLASWRLAREGQRPHATYTFGAPRALDPLAASRYDQLVYRFVNREDIVPHVPLPHLPLVGKGNQYQHVGRATYLHPDAHRLGRVCRWVLRARSALRGFLGVQVFAADALEAHFMDQYIANIESRLVE